VAAARYEEAAFHRAELEAVKRENEALRQRIKDLEKSLSNRSQEGNNASTP
jgi:cell division protein FtsB